MKILTVIGQAILCIILIPVWIGLGVALVLSMIRHRKPVAVYRQEVKHGE